MAAMIRMACARHTRRTRGASSRAGGAGGASSWAHTRRPTPEVATFGRSLRRPKEGLRREQRPNEAKPRRGALLSRPTRCNSSAWRTFHAVALLLVTTGSPSSASMVSRVSDTIRAVHEMKRASTGSVEDRTSTTPAAAASRGRIRLVSKSLGHPKLPRATTRMPEPSHGAVADSHATHEYPTHVACNMGGWRLWVGSVRTLDPCRT